MDDQKVIHLFNRAGFGASYEEVKQAKRLDNLLQKLIYQTTVKDLNYSLPPVEDMSDPPNSKKKRQEQRKDHLLQTIQINNLWFDQMTITEHPLLEKMTLFWTNHFVVEHKTPLTALPYNNLLRQHALGNFRALTKAVAKSAAMINYLHLRQNNKDAPNEDFARELCELFTLGRDQVYTEQDIKEIARAFTGWKLDFQLEYRFAKRQHDFGSKTIFGTTGNFGGEEVIDLILEQKETAVFLSRKLYRNFVSQEEDPVAVQELAEVLYANDYELKPWLEHLFRANWFYEEKHLGNKIKSPTELLVGMARQMGFHYPDAKDLQKLQKVLGQVLFDPPNVAGWPGGRDWIDSSRLILRMQLGNALLQGTEIIASETDPLDTMPNKSKPPRRLRLDVGQIDLQKFRNKHQTKIEEQLALFGKPLSGKFNFSENLVERMAQYTSLPEYQLC